MTCAKKYAKFEGSLKGIDSRILVAQVPGGMLTNLEHQLREQDASDKLDEVLEEIPHVRRDLGFIPLVTPTSQIVGTQAVINVLMGERYKSITKETAGVLKGEYGRTPAPLNAELQDRVLEGKDPITCRPADLIEPEMAQLDLELDALAAEKNFQLAEARIDDVLTYALFPQVATYFFENRHNPDAFEPVPGTEVAEPPKSTSGSAAGSGVYTVTLEGKRYVVEVSDGGDVQNIQTAANSANNNGVAPASPSAGGKTVNAPLAGNIFKIPVTAGQRVAEGDVVLVLEAMKMETAVCAPVAGTVAAVVVAIGDKVGSGDPLMTLLV